MCSRHYLVSHLSVMLLIVFHCMMKVCFLQNSGSSVKIKRKLRQFMITLMITFVRVESISHPIGLGIPSLLYTSRMVNCVWWLIIELSMHRLCLISILFFTLMTCWIASMDVLTLLRLIYSPGIIRFWWWWRITI